MEADRWRAVERLYHGALEHPEGERAAFLKDASAGDEALRLAVESLLSMHGRADAFLETPALELAAPALAEVAPADSEVDLQRLRTALGERYEIERELGRGGMARVYLAYDRKHHRAVAIKVLRPDVAAAIGAARFLREIAIAAQLTHPHILPLHDSGEAGSFLYFVMPHVPDETLRVRLEREGQLPLEDALLIAREVADALGHAHSQGIVHRDIKPENILFAAGHAVVSDFGIARAISVAGGERVTEPGIVVGTPTYMSPEQAAGSEQLDGRSDIYSLGCVLYEMLGGQPPFTGRTAESIIHQHLAAPPPRVTAMRSAVPPATERAIERALAKAPADRFATARQFAEALGVSTLIRAPGRRTLVRALLGLGAALVAVGAAVLFRQRSYALPVDANLVAVAPFDVLDPKLELWREGLVDYLSRNLDGAGPLRTVSPTVVLRRWKGRADPASAIELGRRVGARLVVFGQLIGAGSDSIRLRLTVLDAATGKALAEPERTDRADRIDRLADSLTIDVLRHIGRLGAEAHISLSSLGTKSLPALKAFLKGEQLLRRFSLDSAITAYEEAVQFDATFALALRRRALAGAWRGQSGSSLELKAGSLNHGLAPRDSLLITSDSLEAASDDSLDPAYWSHRLRKFAVLEDASRRYPEDPEVWYSLGEARFHYGYVVGSTAQQALEAFNRAIALDTAFAPAYFHPVQLALDRDDTAAAKRYVNAYLGLTSQVPEGAGIRLVAHLLDPARRTSLEVQHLLDTTSANALFDAWRSVQRFPDAGEVGVQLLRLLATGRRGVGVSVDSVWPRYLLAAELLYRGHVREVRAMVGSRVSVPFTELAVLGIVSPDSVAATFDRWLRSPDEAMAVGDPAFVNRCYRSFPVAGWWARNQDTVPLFRLMHRADAVARTASSLATLASARCDASLARATLALARRDTAEALRRFLAFPDSLCPRLGGPLQLDPLRMVRFQLLAATGRYRDAALLFDQQVSRPLTASSVVATLERGRVAERLDDRAIAIQAYQYVAAVWRNADPELRPYVTEARTALKRLGVDAL